MKGAWLGTLVEGRVGNPNLLFGKWNAKKNIEPSDASND
jgi:hypothetical protein